MIPTFNCAKYLTRTLQSVLDEGVDPGDMHIEVIDDRSTQDNPEEVVQRIGKGRVEFFRQEVNQGVTGNFNTCVRRSRGELVHLLHGDDYVLPGFYDQVGAAARAHSDVALYATRSFIVDEEDELLELSGRIEKLETPTAEIGNLAYFNPLRTPTIVLRRSLYELQGGFDDRLCHVGDWEMWLRAISNGQGLMLNKPLTGYRMFAGNDTGRLARSGENIRDYLRMGSILQERESKFSMERFKIMCATKALEQIRTFERAGDDEAVQKNREIFRELAPITMRLKQAIRNLGSKYGL